MEKKIEDYLHLYLGCDCKVKEFEERLILTGVSYDDTSRVWWAYFENTELGYCTYNEVKPILRPLSSMTEEEVNECWALLEWSEIIKNNRRHSLNEEFLSNNDGNECGWFDFIKILPYLLKKGFDLFGLIESGLAISSLTNKKQ